MNTNRARGLAAMGSVAVLVLVVAGCASFQRLPQEEGLNPRLTRTAYIEEGKLVSIVVDTYPALQRKNDAFLPFPISITNLGLTRIRLDRESFTLQDESGRAYPLASVAEIRASGGSINADWRMSEGFAEVVAGSNANYVYQSLTLFPVLTGDRLAGSRGVLREKVELGKRMWTVDMLYFPRPPGEVAGRKFEIWVRSPDLADPVFVRVRVKP